MSTSKPKKPKWGQRLVRGFIYGIVLGFILYVIGNAFATAVNAAASSTVLAPTSWGLAGLVTGLGAAVGIEVSKEMEE